MAKDIDALIERAEKQLVEARKLVADHKNNNRGHLIDAVEREIKELESVQAQMKTLQKNVTKRTSEINNLEERLLNLENRIGEELAFVEEVYASHNATNRTANELVELGQKLVAQAKPQIDRYQDHSHYVVQLLEDEVKGIEQAIKTVQTHPSTSREFNDAEESLVRHEKTLQALLFRLQRPFRG